MNFGNIQGLVSGVDSVVFDYEVTGSAVSSISTGNILNGNEDGWYTIIVRHIGVTASSNIYLRMNGDATTSNYGRKSIYASNTTVGDSSTTSEAGMFLTDVSSSSSAFVVLRVYAKSGSVRLVNGTIATGISTTTVSYLYNIGYVWNNTTDNLTNMVFASAGSYIGIGSRVIILKSNNFTNGTPTGSITTPYIKGAWVRVASNTLSVAGNSIPLTGLDGDRDVIYLIKSRIKCANELNGVDTAYIKLNSDTGNNYGYQYLAASNTSVAAARTTGYGKFNACEAGNANYEGSFDAVLFAKSGFVRPMILNQMNNINGATVGAIRTIGEVYSNTADNITGLTVFPYQNNFAAGSYVEAYALRPNG